MLCCLVRQEQIVFGLVVHGIDTTTQHLALNAKWSGVHYMSLYMNCYRSNDIYSTHATLMLCHLVRQRHIVFGLVYSMDNCNHNYSSNFQI